MIPDVIDLETGLSGRIVDVVEVSGRPDVFVVDLGEHLTEERWLALPAELAARLH